MADEANVTQNNSEGANTATDNNTATPTVEELMAQLATERAEKERNKIALDKALKEKGDVTKALRAKQTAEEQEASAKAEAERLANEERERLTAELNLLKAQNAYKDISEKSVEGLIKAVAESDHKAIAEVIANEIALAVNTAKEEWLKSRPGINVGTGSNAMTKEQIMAITDREERQRAIASNLSLFQ